MEVFIEYVKEYPALYNPEDKDCRDTNEKDGLWKRIVDEMKNPNISDNNDRKMTLQVTCSKCKRKVDPKNTMLCSLCRNNYEFDCVGYSERLYRLKDAAAKSKWKCKDCSQKSKGTSTPYSSLSHVTTRKYKIGKKSYESPSTSSAIFMPTETGPSEMAPASVLVHLDDSQTMQTSIAQLNASPINQIDDPSTNFIPRFQRT
ncbi:unnamed protein product [Parnassius apollo]|uniref:(apollo) hypothetical protein n=1 Tax=Parnassius apollo TaxID=110799 RepID=A0A8S3WP46_PARAO|nr:unnamed protein product [Parnassius apollo]